MTGTSLLIWSTKTTRRPFTSVSLFYYLYLFRWCSKPHGHYNGDEVNARAFCHPCLGNFAVFREILAWGTSTFPRISEGPRATFRLSATVAWSFDTMLQSNDDQVSSFWTILCCRRHKFRCLKPTNEVWNFRCREMKVDFLGDVLSRDRKEFRFLCILQAKMRRLQALQLPKS